MSTPKRCPNPKCGSSNKLSPEKLVRKIGGDKPLSVVEYCADPWHTAPAPATEPPRCGCDCSSCAADKHCMFGLCRPWSPKYTTSAPTGTPQQTQLLKKLDDIVDSASDASIAFAHAKLIPPTGTGEGSESTAHLYIPKAQYAAKVAELNAENAALRSQLEEARRELKRYEGMTEQCVQDNIERTKAESDLATAQQRLATTRAEFSYSLIEEDDTQRELSALHSRLATLEAAANLALEWATKYPLSGSGSGDDELAAEHVYLALTQALAASPSKTGSSRTVEQNAAKSERQYDHSDPWNTMGPWDEQ